MATIEGEQAVQSDESAQASQGDLREECRLLRAHIDGLRRTVLAMGHTCDAAWKEHGEIVNRCIDLDRQLGAVTAALRTASAERDSLRKERDRAVELLEQPIEQAEAFRVHASEPLVSLCVHCIALVDTNASVCPTCSTIPCKLSPAAAEAITLAFEDSKRWPVQELAAYRDAKHAMKLGLARRADAVSRWSNASDAGERSRIVGEVDDAARMNLILAEALKDATAALLLALEGL